MRSDPPTSPRLELVEFIPAADADPVVCGAVWQHGRDVHLLAPALRDAATGADALGFTLSWLDAACFAATDADEARQACDENPDWHLRCRPFDGSDHTLRALADLMHACRRGRAGR